MCGYMNIYTYAVLLQVYRHSFLADYTLYNLNNGTTSNISMPSNAKGRIQLALWSPVQSVIVSGVGRM